MPSHLRDEDWRRTDISTLHLEEFAPDPPDATATTPNVSTFGVAKTGDCPSTEMRPGEPWSEELIATLRGIRDSAAPGAAFLAITRRGVRASDDTDPLAAQGVVVSSLEEAAVKHPELVQRGLATMPSDTKFSALWNALWRGGCFVYVPPSVAACVPVFAAYTTGGERPAIFPATVAVLDHGSSLTLVDAYASAVGGSPLLSVAGTALVLGDGARLDYCLLQRWGEGAWHIATHQATVGRDARLRFFGSTLGARLQKAYWEVIAAGSGAEADITGVCFGDGAQHLDHQSLQLHRGPSTRTNYLLKVAVRDQAKSVYSGLIAVEKSAQKSDGYVQNRNLILSSGAKADSIPRLEIKANDVRCGHGATAGHIDSDQRFYLMARGIPAAEADQLIARGFMQDALDKCPHEGMRNLVATYLDEEIAGQSLAGLAAEA